MGEHDPHHQHNDPIAKAAPDAMENNRKMNRHHHQLNEHGDGRGYGRGAGPNDAYRHLGPR
jgi:hypothetical protein